MDEDSGEYTAVAERTLGYALTGAVLIELDIRHRIDVSVDTLTATDPTPLDDDLLDPVLADIVAVSCNGAQHPEFWVRRIVQGSEVLRATAMEGLAAQGMVQADESGFFFLSRRASQERRHAAAQSRQVDETRSRILEVIFTDVIPDSRDTVIIGLAHACGIFQSILSPDEYEAALPRIELISRLEMLSQSVVEGIRNLTLAEAYARRRGIQEKGGGWPKASGHVPIIGHILQFRRTINGFLTEQYRNLGPVFEISLFGKKWLVLAGPGGQPLPVAGREGPPPYRSRSLAGVRPTVRRHPSPGRNGRTGTRSPAPAHARRLLPRTVDQGPPPGGIHGRTRDAPVAGEPGGVSLSQHSAHGGGAVGNADVRHVATGTRGRHIDLHPRAGNGLHGSVVPEVHGAYSHRCGAPAAGWKGCSNEC